LKKYGLNKEREEKEERDTKENNTKRNDNFNNANNIDNFLKESSIRDRLRRLPSIQDLVHNSNEPRLNSRERSHAIDNFHLQETSMGNNSRALFSTQEMDSRSSSINQERAISLNESREQSNIDDNLNNYSTNNTSVQPFQSYRHKRNYNNVNVNTHRINLYDNSVISGSTGFRQTLKEIIMVPYVENNKTVSKGSQMYVFLKI